MSVSMRFPSVGRRHRVAAAFSAAAVLALPLLASSPALATTGLAYADQFGGAGNADGQFTGGPSGLVVDQASGDVFASDPGHTLSDGTPAPRVERFDANGAFQSAIDLDGTAYNSPGPLASDPAGTGSIYVSAFDSAFAPAVLKYSTTGAFAYQLDFSTSGTTIIPNAPIAVDPGNGTVFVAAIDNTTGAQVIDTFDPDTGTFVAELDGASGSPDGGFGCPTALAADSAHRVYVLDGCKNRVDQYSAAGVFGATVDDGVRGGPAAVTADPTSGEVFVAEFGALGLQITRFTAGGAAADQTFGATNVGSPAGLAVDHASGTVYTADNGNSVVERFTAFDGPTVTTTAAAPVGAASATLNGTIDPGGAAATYHFEYGADISYGTNTGDTAAGSGSAAVPASAVLTGLNPNTTYHYRIVGTNSRGSINGDDETLTTAPAAPSVDGVPVASAITPTSARIHGVVDPNFSQTGFHVDYGLTAGYGSTVPQPDADAGSAGTGGAVAAALTGLTPGTTYHFRITADNGTGGPQHGVDGTFITAPGPAAGATDVTTKRATLTGTINAHGAATTYHFDYGPTAAYGASTSEADGGNADGDRGVSQPIEGLQPSTTYHVQVVATTNGQTRTGADGTFTTPPAPVATATNPIGVTTGAATLTGTADTHGLPGTYQFVVASLDSSYATTTAEQPVPSGSAAQPVAAPLSGLPPGETFRVQLIVTSNDATQYSDQITFATAALPPPVPAPIGSTWFGCAAPSINPYNAHPKPGDTIAISGGDLGVGGTVALGSTPLPPSGWTASGFTVQIPQDASGTLPLTVNCGHTSNTIALAIYHEPSNAFSITKKSVRGTVATLTVNVPGVGKVQTAGKHAKGASTTITKAGAATVKVRLSAAGAKALKKAKSHKLKITVRVTFTPAGGKPATKTSTVTFKRKAGR